MGRQKVPLGFSDRAGFSADFCMEAHQRRLHFRTLLTFDLPTSKPLNGVIKGGCQKQRRDRRLAFFYRSHRHGGRNGIEANESAARC